MRKAHLLLLLLLPALPAFSQDERPYCVGSIHLSGFREVKPGRVRGVMRIKFPSWLAWLPLVPHPEYDGDTLEGDIRRIRTLYENLGYYHAAVVGEVRRDERRRCVAVRITANEGRRTMVEAVTIDVAGSPDERLLEALRRRVALAKGAPFIVDEYRLSKDRMGRYLANHGYPEGRVEGRAVIDKRSYASRVTFTAVPGSRAFFGPVTVSGIEDVKKKDVVRELTFREGDVFSSDALYHSQQNLIRMGVFESVVLDAPYERRDEGNRIPVEVQIEEATKRTLRLGAGYGNEDGFRVRGQWIRRYFLGLPSTLDLSLRSSSLIHSASLDYRQPYFLNRFTSLGVRLGYDREFLTVYTNERISSQAKISRSFGRTAELFAAYNLEMNRPLAVSRAVLAELFETRPDQYYFISSLLFGVEHTTVDDFLYPTRGYASSVFIEPSTFLLGSTLDYVKGFVRLRAYHRPFSSVVLALQTEFGFIEPSRFTRDIPIFKRFFLGGSNSVRGYPFNGVGPLSAGGEPTGGHYMVLGNAELRYPLYRKLRGVVFLDAGNVYRASFDFSFPGLSYGVGTGIRYATLIGPLRVDIAFPAEKMTYVDINRYRLYFTLGHPF